MARSRVPLVTMAQRCGGRDSEQAGGSGKDDDVMRIGDFAALQVAELGFGVELGREQANRVDGAASVGGVGGLRGIEAVADAPVAPDAGDSGSAVDQHAVEIEEDSLHQQR